MTPAQRRAMDRLWPRYGLDYRAAHTNLEEIYGRQAERVLEIGFGDGESLVAQAAGQPAVDYLGIEVHDPGVGHCLLRAEASDLRNLRVICHDAVEVLQQQLPPASLARVNLYFPDPWPKKRHHKRRLFQPPFVDLVAGVLAPGGRFYVATDWPNYAEQIDDVAMASSLFVMHTRREHAGAEPLDRPTTRFERRARESGRTIYEWRFDRV